MHRSGLGALIIDCETNDLDLMAEFWSKALGYDIEPSSDPQDAGYRYLKTPAGRPMIAVQQVTHPSRVHLDIKTDNVDAEVERLERLAARKVGKTNDWWVMEAPSGHRFCVVPLRAGEDRGPLNEW